MDIRSKLLAKKFKDNNYFTNLNEYINHLVDEKKISYKNLKYLYTKMYMFKSLFIKQNIYQVGQFLSKGYTIKEAEQVAKLLPDASGLSVFCYSKIEKGHIYNKLFKDLEYYYNLYDKEVKKTGDKKIALKFVQSTIKETNKQKEQNNTKTKQSVLVKLKEANNLLNKSKIKNNEKER